MIWRCNPHDANHVLYNIAYTILTRYGRISNILLSKVWLSDLCTPVWVCLGSGHLIILAEGLENLGGWRGWILFSVLHFKPFLYFPKYIWFTCKDAGLGIFFQCTLPDGGGGVNIFYDHKGDWGFFHIANQILLTPPPTRINWLLLYISLRYLCGSHSISIDLPIHNNTSI